VNPRLWIYWAVTVPATVIVFTFWNVWYSFEDSRHWRRKGKNFSSEFSVWLRSRHGKEEDRSGNLKKGESSQP